MKKRGVRGTVVNPINVSTVQQSSSQQQQRKLISHIFIFKIVQHLEYICMCKFAEFYEKIVYTVMINNSPNIN